jgi:hypothetical protein
MEISGKSLILKSLEAASANFNAHRGSTREGQGHPSAQATVTKQAMTKSLEVIAEAVVHPKHPFRKVDNQPKKPQKHRYERRKIREYLHLGDWVTSEAT